MSAVVMRRDVTRLFAGEPVGLQIFEQIARIIDGLGENEIRVTRSQVSFRHVRTFALVWRPSMYVATRVPVVLSIAMPVRASSSRFKQIVHPEPTTWMHHLELRDLSEIDDEVGTWLATAWSSAGVARAVWARSGAPSSIWPGVGPMAHHGATVRTAPRESRGVDSAVGEGPTNRPDRKES